MFGFLFMVFGLILGTLLLFTLILCLSCLVICIPYRIWFCEHGRGDIPVIEKRGLGAILHETANAFRLYQHWITGKPHNIKYFSIR